MHAPHIRITEKAARVQQFPSSIREICAMLQWRGPPAHPVHCSRDTKSCSRASRALTDAANSFDGDGILSKAAVPDLHRSNWRMLA
jgi:hypothetical protein